MTHVPAAPSAFSGEAAAQAAQATRVRDLYWYPLSRFYLRPLAKAIARRGARGTLRPNAVTLTGFLAVAVAAVLLAASPSLHGLVAQVLPAGFILFYWMLDQVDGHLARLAGRCTDYGAWLDANLDELADVLLHAAGACGLWLQSGSSLALVWLAAFLAGKYLLMYGLQTRGARERIDDSPATAANGRLRWLYHLPANADLRFHLTAAAALTAGWWWELPLIAAYYNARWIARHLLMYRRASGEPIAHDDRFGFRSEIAGVARSRNRREMWETLAVRCQKPGYQVYGNWMARNVARPLALRVTRYLVRWPISAHAVTATATLVGLSAAVCFGYGGAPGLCAGAVALQLWYLLDHVDGQVARYRGTASLSGTYADYLMHYLVHAAAPVGVGWGLYQQTGWPLGLLAGVLWSFGTTWLALTNDCLYKAMFRPLRLSSLARRVRGAADGGPQPAMAMPSWRQPLRLGSYLLQKMAEMHVVMNVLSVVALASAFQPPLGRWLVAALLGIMAATVPLVALVRTVRTIASGRPDREFTAWFGPLEAESEVRVTLTRFRIEEPTTPATV